MSHDSRTPDPRHATIGIPVDTESPSAEWVQWASRGRGRSVAALDVGGRMRALFVPNEILVHRDERNLAHRLVAEFGAEIVPPRPLPPPPPGLEPRRDVDPMRIPVPTRLRFRVPPPVPDGAATIVREALGDRATAARVAALGVSRARRPCRRCTLRVF
jgi:hypothetical protein